ncbi:MAG: OmpA/MotB family protein [Planctomycetota bacterium]|jgi:chemotaxis protein MotB
MPLPLRSTLCFLAGSLTLLSTGCNSVPGSWHRQAALRNRELYQQTQALAQQNAAKDQATASVLAEKQKLERALLAERERRANLDRERAQLNERFISLRDQLARMENPLSQSANQKFADLAKRFPGFNFDPETGVSKFSSDLLFDSGSANIKSDGRQLLKEFAAIMNEGDAQRLNILVAGHTDDKPIRKASTAQHHATNWHLSTNRANEVLVSLQKAGVRPARMSSAGYGEFQPLVPNSSDRNRSQNRRVEIFVLAPEASIAGWDPKDTATR